MRYLKCSLLLTCSMAMLWSSSALSREFCVSTEEEYREALTISAANHEDDSIMVVEGADFPPMVPQYEIGYSLQISTGYDSFCTPKPTAEGRAMQEGSYYQEDGGDIPEPQLSTSGPRPFLSDTRTAAADTDESLTVSGEEKVLGVPAYIWRHGCAPTAVGMLLGYWDTRGMIDLFEGSAAVENETIKQAMASSDHYNDYSLPYDATTSSIQEDLSETPDLAHDNDSIADFLYTSRSIENLRYGWTSSARIIPAMREYTASKNPDYAVEYRDYYMITSYHAFSWDILTTEIDNNRPMIFLVDSRGDGYTDHFVTVVGYRTEPTLQYASLDTWDHSIHWHDFNKIESGVSWGIWGAWAYQPDSKNMAAVTDEVVDPPVTPSVPEQEPTIEPLTSPVSANEVEPEPNVEPSNNHQENSEVKQKTIVAVLNIIDKLLLNQE